MKAKTWLNATLTLAVAGSLVAGCTTTGDNAGEKAGETKPADNTSAKKETVVNTYINGEIPTIDPTIAKDSASSWVLDHVFEGLYFQDKDGLKPGQAKEVKVSDDGLVYTFTLKDNLKWSNGDPVTAADFEFSWKHVLNPKTASEYAYQIADYIKGGKEYNGADSKLSEAEMNKLRDAVGVKAQDEKTLVVTLASPTPYFLQLTSFYTYYPVNKKVVEANPNWAAEASTHVGNGPFKVTEWGKDKRLVVQKNENYYNKDAITASEVVWNNITDDNTAWQMFTAGDLNVYRSVTPAAVDQAKASGELVVTPKLSTYFYRINVNKAPFNNAKVRKALAMAIERQPIIDNILKTGQKPAFAFVSPGIQMGGKDFRDGEPGYFKEDMAEAKKLLEEGLSELNLTSMPKFTVSYNTNEGHKKIAEAIQEMWKKNLGVEATLENIEWKVYLDKVQKLDYQIARAGWIGDYLDPMTYIDMFVTGGTNNETGWSNAKYDELVAAAKKEQKEDVRIQLFRDAEKILMDEMPIIPIYFYTSANAYKTNLEGYYSPANREPIFRYVTSK
ncbi:peptide ABC transporter substrate-binding protein [Paenibacillus turpanensis]|uniref:peptide ABC transporter substrate-binding protein n=1 Tax=Paenibacillus turpanensis TaxID=2689078 RepID=UPI00140A04C5|nr:peptide ABC transporter substrate-binding protein [Paenibacillus turpanensis]